MLRMRTPRAVFGNRALRPFDAGNAAGYWALHQEELRLRKQGKSMKLYWYKSANADTQALLVQKCK
jgi:hypothetical protein